MKAEEEIRTHMVRGWVVSYFLVETRKAKEANIFICLGCGSVYGNSFLVDPHWPLTTTIALHHSSAGSLDKKCKRSLYLKVNWDLIEAENKESEAAPGLVAPESGKQSKRRRGLPFPSQMSK
jgi:hypothetical protein